MSGPLLFSLWFLLSFHFSRPPDGAMIYQEQGHLNKVHRRKYDLQITCKMSALLLLNRKSRANSPITMNARARLFFVGQPILKNLSFFLIQEACPLLSKSRICLSSV